jgi:hypothetical protein
VWADFDGDGRNEFVAGKRYLAHEGADPGAYDEVAVFRYQFDPMTRTWHRWTVSYGERVSMGLDPKAEDIDGDGDLDIVASGRSGLYLLENTGRQSAPRSGPVVPDYPDHSDLTVVRGSTGELRAVQNAADWGLRRTHIVTAIEDEWGNIPLPEQRVPLDMQIQSETVDEKILHKQIRYRTDRSRQIVADLLIPTSAALGMTPGLICEFKPESVPGPLQVARQFAEQGYVCLVPRPIRTETRLASSPIMDEIWQVMRGVDVLQAVNEVHGELLGYVGPAGRGLLLASLDQRLVAVVATDSHNLGRVAQQGKFTTSELIGSLAPRAVSINLDADDAEIEQVKLAAKQAAKVYELRNVAANLQLVSFEEQPSGGGYSGMIDWLNRHLKRTQRRAIRGR